MIRVNMLIILSFYHISAQLVNAVCVRACLHVFPGEGDDRGGG